MLLYATKPSINKAKEVFTSSIKIRVSGNRQYILTYIQVTALPMKK